MSTVNGFQVGSEVLKYNYESLDNYNTPNFSTSSSKTYAVGDYVMYNGKLYKCTTATTGGTWVSSNWTEAVLSDDVSEIKRQLSDKPDIGLGITGASVGKYARIKTVDANGRPTSWEYGSSPSGGGTDDYTDLTNKPSINGVTLVGNKTSIDLGIEDIVYPEQFGAVGDGVTDDAEAIQDAINYCILNHKKLVFQPKTYGVIPYQQDKSIVQYNNTYYALLIKGSINIDLNGAVIQTLTNTISIFTTVSIYDAENVQLRNGTIRGDRDTYTVSGDNTNLLGIYESKNVLIDNIIMENSKGDCFGHSGVQKGQPYVNRDFVDYYMGNVIQNCTMRNAARHGMTFSKGRGVTFYNVRIEDINPKNDLDWSGNAVDMEPYYGYGSIFDVRFDCCSMTENASGPYIQDGDTVRFTNCYLQGVGFRGAYQCMVDHCVLLNGCSANGTDVVYSNCLVGGQISIYNSVNGQTIYYAAPSIILQNNICTNISFDSRTSNFKLNNLIIEKNQIVGPTANINLLLNPNTYIDDGEILIVGNNVLKTGFVKATNLTISKKLWTDNPEDTSAEYPFRAAIDLKGVLSSMTATVVFSNEAASSENFADFATCAKDVVYIYAINKPSESIVVDSILANQTSASPNLVSVSNADRAMIKDNMLIYDVLTAGQTSYVVNVDNVRKISFVGNTIQRKSQYTDDVTYTSVLRQIIRLNDVDTMFASDNIINFENTVFSTLSLALIKSSTTGNIITKLILNNNYGYDIDSIMQSDSAATVLLDNNNVWNNESPLPIYNGGVSP